MRSGRCLGIECVQLLAFAGIVLTGMYCAAEGTPYQATGIKIGEVTDTEAIVWTRLTRLSERVGPEAPMPKVGYRNPKTGETEVRMKHRPDWDPVVEFPEDSSIDTIEGAVPGMSGQVRVSFRSGETAKWTTTEWSDVDPERDFTHQFKLTDLKPDTLYAIRIECRASEERKQGQTLEGRFRTAPPPDQPARVVFMVSTGQEYKDQDAPGGGYKIYPKMVKLDPSFFVHTGDIVYYDGLAKTLPLARWHWARTYSLPTNLEFHRLVPSYFIKDDHDTWMNDCWPTLKTKFMGEFTFKQGQAVFLDEVPMGPSTQRTFRWGKDLQIWLPEGRDFRSPNTMKDGPEKTIWGEEQKAWFKRTVQESDATFRVLISPTPLVGPDRTSKGDNHANKAFAHEGRELRAFIAQQKNMVIMCGDRHWQYVSVDPESGAREYSCGPASNEHAGGWSDGMFMPQHKYLKVIGGFLAATVDRIDGKPTMILRHYSVNGEILNEDRLVAE